MTSLCSSLTLATNTPSADSVVMLQISCAAPAKKAGLSSFAITLLRNREKMYIHDTVVGNYQ